MYRVVLLTFVCGVYGQAKLPGSCDVQPGQAFQDVNVLAMLGTWYQLQRVPNSDENGDCSTMSFDIIDPTIGTIALGNQLNGVVNEKKGTIIKEGDATGRFIVNYDSEIFYYWVLATDYFNYAIVYSCKDNTDDTKNVWAWAIARSRDFTPSDTALEDLQAAAGRNPDLSAVTWTQPSQSECTN